MWYFLFTGLLCLNGLAQAAPAPQKDCFLTQSGVYVSPTSEAEFSEGVILRWLEVHWWGVFNRLPGDKVAIWDHDPTSDMSHPLDEEELPFINMTMSAVGVFRSTVQWNGTMPSDQSSHCLGFWGGYIRQDEILHYSCLHLNPDWMWEIKDSIMNIGIADVFLPGTHDAGAVGAFGHNIIGDVAERWIITQDELFLEQLFYGVRYLDMRISYYEETDEKFFVNHGDARIAPLQGYIDAIHKFLSQSNEIVIFDIHSLEHDLGSNYDAQDELITLLETTFNTWIAPSTMGPNPSLQSLWDSNYKIIITFPKSTSSPVTWTNVHHLWGDVNNIEDLFSYLDNGIPTQTGRGFMWSSMAEFTPTALDITLNRWGGLRGAAAITNPTVSEWVRNSWWKQVNIVAMDFIMSSDIVSIAIEANLKRTECIDQKINES